MSIELQTTADGLLARQAFHSPTVYMDHWAVRLFSDDYRLQDRFVRTLGRKRGTLVLSGVSIHEFQRPQDDQHCASAERFLERVLPDLYFTNFNFQELIAQERTQPDNRSRFPPPTDQQTLDFLIKLAEREGHLTVRGLIAGAHVHRDSAVATVNAMNKEFRAALERARSDPKYVAKARSARRDPTRTRTMIILGDLVRHFHLDPKAKFCDNDVIDLFHAAMPINCCDYVLLDGPWYERVRTMERSIQKDGFPMPIAKCFSKRDDGVEAFLLDLVNFGL